MCEWMEGDWNRMVHGDGGGEKKIRSQHLQGANIIGSQKECLRASAVVNSPFVSRGPGLLRHCSVLEKELDFFFFRWFLFPSRRLTFPPPPAHRWADLIRTFLSDLFTIGRWLYLWPIPFEWKRDNALQKKKKMANGMSGWGGGNKQSSSQVMIYQNEVACEGLRRVGFASNWFSYKFLGIFLLLWRGNVDKEKVHPPHTPT